MTAARSTFGANCPPECPSRKAARVLPLDVRHRALGVERIRHLRIWNLVFSRLQPRLLLPLEYLHLIVSPLWMVERRRLSRSSMAFRFVRASRGQSAWPIRLPIFWQRRESDVQSRGRRQAQVRLSWSRVLAA